MTHEINQSYPLAYSHIEEATKLSGFTMASEVLTCSFLRTMAAAKPGGSFLELGTGTGLSTAWILDGMDSDATLTSIDNDENVLTIARSFLGYDNRLQLVCSDGAEWVDKNMHRQAYYDYIFADTWHGKYLLLEPVLAMLKKGGLYIIDDMLPQPNWPDGHHEKALNLINVLEQRKDLTLTKQVWATGIVVAAKK